MSIAKILKEARNKKDETLDRVSKIVGISTSYIHDLENGNALRPKIAVLSILADYYGLDRDKLIIASGKIPSDVYFKIVNNPQLLEVVRNYSI